MPKQKWRMYPGFWHCFNMTVSLCARPLPGHLSSWSVHRSCRSCFLHINAALMKGTTTTALRRRCWKSHFFSQPRRSEVLPISSRWETRKPEVTPGGFSNSVPTAIKNEHGGQSSGHRFAPLSGHRARVGLHPPVKMSAAGFICATTGASSMGRMKAPDSCRNRSRA